MTNTYTSDVQVLIQFAKDQGWDLPDVMEAVARLEAAIAEGSQRERRCDENLRDLQRHHKPPN